MYKYWCVVSVDPYLFLTYFHTIKPITRFRDPEPDQRYQMQVNNSRLAR